MIQAETQQPVSLLPILAKRLYGLPGLAEQPVSGIAQNLSELIIESDLLNESFVSLTSPSANSLEISTLLSSLSASPLSSPSESLESSPFSSRPSTPSPASRPQPRCSSPSPSLFIRPFHPDDQARVDEIGELCYPPEIEDDNSFLAKLYVGDSFVAVDSLSGAVVAYAIGLPWHKEPLHINESPTRESIRGADVYVVHDVAVHPGCRGGGVASMLLDQLLSCARERLLNKAVLVAINATAKIVWGKKGFVPMACTSDGGGYGPDATKMERTL